MSTYEDNANAFEKILDELGPDIDPSFSEADTRSKLIDRILKEALGWPDYASNIRREEYVHHGYIDYVLRSKNSHMVIEAKKIGRSFKLSDSMNYNKRLSVKNLLQKQADLKKMYDQVTRYAHESGIMLCGLTNGTQWLFFPGVRTDNIHIRHSKVVMFNGLNTILENFLDFWNLLSFESFGSGGMTKAIVGTIEKIEKSYSFSTDERLQVLYDKNPLTPVLMDVLPRYFGDLHGDPGKTELLMKCFVYEESVEEKMRYLGLNTNDEKPSEILKSNGPILHFYSLPQVAERLKLLIDSFLENQPRLYLQILVGRVGIGKTTFLHYFFETNKRTLKDENFTLYLDLRDTNEHTDLNKYFIDSLWALFTTHAKYKKIMVHSTLQKVFADEIELLEAGPLALLKEKNPDDYYLQISHFLQKQMEDKPTFLKKVVSYINENTDASFLLIFDNVDQLPIDLQQKVIRFAYSKGIEFRAFLIISMWEETYYTSKRTGQVLSTIRTVPMQVTRQSITSVITKRIKYLVEQIKSGRESLRLLDKKHCSREAFCNFFELVMRSFVYDNRKVRMFLEAIALGNIRMALEIFFAFLTAGSLDSKRIISLMKRHDDYVIPLYEFVTCVGLGNRRYYSSRTSEIVNLFSVGDMVRPSHFSGLRIMHWLYERRHEATPFGTGFMTIKSMMEYFRHIGISQKDISGTIVRMYESFLVEDEYRSRQLQVESKAIRITPTGRFYLTFLFKQFAYIDLVLQDTPIFDKLTFTKIGPKFESNKISDRLKRCDFFIEYLEEQENEELEMLSKLKVEYRWNYRFTDSIRNYYESTKEFVNVKRYKKK